MKNFGSYGERKTELVGSDHVSVVLFVFLLISFLLTTHSWNFVPNALATSEQDVRVVELVPENPVRRVVFLLLGALGLVKILNSLQRYHLVPNIAGWMISAAVGWAVLSVFWSTAPELSIRRVVSFFAVGVAAFGFSRILSPKGIARLVFGLCFAFLVFGIAAEYFHGVFTPFISGYRFAGSQSPNNQAMNCVFLLLAGTACFGYFERNRWIYRTGAALGFVFLVLTKSRTSFAAGLLAYLVFRLFGRRDGRNSTVVFLLILTVLVTTLFLGESAGSRIQSGVNLGRQSEQDASLNGRKWLWMECRGYAGARPIIGYGFNGFWTPERIQAVSWAQGWTIASAHSMYFDVILEMGLVGFVLFVGSIVMAGRSCWLLARNNLDGGYEFFCAFFIFFVLQGLLESMFVQPGFYSFVSLVIFSSIGFEGRRRNL